MIMITVLRLKKKIASKQQLKMCIRVNTYIFYLWDQWKQSEFVFIRQELQGKGINNTNSLLSMSHDSAFGEISFDQKKSMALI